MKLTTAQIFSCARGVVYTSEEDGYLRLHRFTPVQEEFHKGLNEENYDRTFATAGVILEFDTDSRTLGLSVLCRKGSSRHWFVHSILVNGRRIGELRGKYTPPEYVTAEDSWSLGEGEKRVRIVFPWSAGSEVKALTLDDGAAFVPVKKEKRVLIYGDSITHGYDSAQPENAYSYVMSEYLDANCVNKAIGGAVFRPALGALADDFQPDLITMAYGTNDWAGVNNEKLEAHALGFLQALRKNYPNTKLVMLAPVWRNKWDRERPLVTFPEIPEIFRRIAAQVGNVEVIDCFKFIPPDESCFSPDILHPNDKGFGYYGEGVVKALKELGI